MELFWSGGGRETGTVNSVDFMPGALYAEKYSKNDFLPFYLTK
jgi:hypothetical protein